MTIDLKHKIIVLTGAGHGLGHALALALAKAQARLILISKQEQALLNLDDQIRIIQKQQIESGLSDEISIKGATIIPMDLTAGDLTSGDQVGDHLDGLASNIFKRFGKIDALISNAGILGTLSPLSHLSPKEFNAVMNLNLRVPFRLIRAFEPLLKNAHQQNAHQQNAHQQNTNDLAKAIFISCDHAPKAYWGAYLASKAGLEAMVQTWAQEVKSFHIDACCFDPKPMNTRLRTKAYPGIEGENWPTPDQYAVPEILKILTHNRMQDDKI